jgi:hypothetical protein
MEIDPNKFDWYAADNTGFTRVNEDYPQTVFQCVMCFGLVLAGVPRFTGMPFSGVDPFQHHRNNCFGWQKV